MPRKGDSKTRDVFQTAFDGIGGERGEDMQELGLSDDDEECWACGAAEEGVHEKDCERMYLGGTETSSQRLEARRVTAYASEPATNRQRLLKGSIKFDAADREAIREKTDRLVAMVEEGDDEALVQESVRLTAMNIAFIEQLTKKPPEGRSNTQALLNHLAEARGQLIELVALVRSRHGKEPSKHSRATGGRKKKRSTGARRN